MNLSLILALFWLSSPVAPLIPNLDNALSHVYTVQTGRVVIPDDQINDALLRKLWLPCYAVFMVLALREFRSISLFLIRNWVLSLLLGWAAVSFLWSVSPDDTLRRWLALVICTIGGIVLGVRCGNVGTARLLAAALVLGIAASFVCSIAFPATGISGGGSYMGSWRGVYSNKNSLGGTMLKACFVFWLLYYVDQNRWWLVALGFAVLLLALSMAMTPVVVLAVLAAILTVAHVSVRSPRRAAPVAALGIALLIAVFAAAIVFREALLAIVDRDPTFTGRTEIWALTWEAIGNRFWEGYGYAAFWSEHYGPATAIWDSLNWRVPNSHSGILEIWLGLGVVGVVLFAVFVIHSCSLLMRRAGRIPLPELLWCIGVWLMFLVYATTESASMEHNSLGWVLTISVVAALHRGAETDAALRSLRQSTSLAAQQRSISERYDPSFARRRPIA